MPRPVPRGRQRRQAAAGLACAAVVAVAAMLASLPEAGGAPAPTAPVQRDVAYLGAGGPTLDVHRPARPRRRPAPAVLVIHGGAWSGGDKSAIGHVAQSLARAGFVAINVNYTLAAPGLPGFPRQLDELRAAVRWVRRHARELGADGTRIGALGSSAGAHLAALLAVTGAGQLDSGDRIAAAVAWSAPTDLRDPRLRARLPSKLTTFLGCARCPRRASVASPVNHADRGDAPVLIVNSTRELIPVGQARLLAARLRAAGAPQRLLLVPGTLHAPRYSPSVLGGSIAFLRRRLG